MSRSVLLLAACLVLLTTPGSARGQSAAEERLPPLDPILPAEFWQNTSIRELPDGRVLVVDAGEHRLLVADFRTGTTTAVSRRGDGPGEYRNPRTLLALSGDSTLLVDPSARRWLLLSGDVVVATLPKDSPLIEATGGGADGVDAHGEVLVRRGGSPQPGDSAFLLRVARHSAAVDTVTRLVSEASGAKFMTRTERGGRQATDLFLPLPVAAEQAAIVPDGWVAVVRLDPYRVEWYAPDGTVIRGPVLAADLADLNGTEKRFVLQRRADALGRPPSPLEANPVWRPRMPPYEGRSGALLAEPRGRLLVRRAPTRSRPVTQYDEIDRMARQTATFVLSPNQHLVGFGMRSVYVVSVDDDGIQRLGRAAWAPRR